MQKANQGDADAQYHYGMQFINGTGDEVKPRIAIEWLMKAQAQGHEGAKKQISSMFDLGFQLSNLESAIRVYK
jgi:TPR repeat protein